MNSTQLLLLSLFLSFSDCGKQERERVSSLGSGHSTGAEASILKVNLILKKSGNVILAKKGQL